MMPLAREPPPKVGGLAMLLESERQLVRRAATLSAESERQEAEWANGRPFELFAPPLRP